MTILASCDTINIPCIYEHLFTILQAFDNTKKSFSYIIDKKELEKIILCESQIKIYPELEKSFLNMLHNSGYPDIKFEKKVDFEGLYKKRFN